MQTIANSQYTEQPQSIDNNNPDDLAYVLSCFLDDDTALKLSRDSNSDKSKSLDTASTLFDKQIRSCSKYVDIINSSVVSLSRCNKHKYCAVCNRSRSNKTYHCVRKHTEKLTNKHPTLKAYSLMLTTGNTVEFSSVNQKLKSFNAAFTRLKSKLKTVVGYIKCNEISESKNKAHVHSHIILLSTDTLHRSDLEKLWIKSLKSKKQSIYIDLNEIEYNSSVIASLVKYAVKAVTDDRNKISDHNLSALVQQLKHTRLISTGGLYKSALKQSKGTPLNPLPQFVYSIDRYTFTSKELPAHNCAQANQDEHLPMDDELDEHLDVNSTGQDQSFDVNLEMDQHLHLDQNMEMEMDQHLHQQPIKNSFWVRKEQDQQQKIKTKKPGLLNKKYRTEHPAQTLDRSSLDLCVHRDVYYDSTNERQLIYE